jgi:hypothetical protein
VTLNSFWLRSIAHSCAVLAPTGCTIVNTSNELVRYGWKMTIPGTWSAIQTEKGTQMFAVSDMGGGNTIMLDSLPRGSETLLSQMREEMVRTRSGSKIVQEEITKLGQLPGNGFRYVETNDYGGRIERVIFVPNEPADGWYVSTHSNAVTPDALRELDRVVQSIVRR